MDYTKPVVDIIPTRSSMRTYTPTPIEPEKLQFLQDAMAESTTGPFGGQARFVWVELDAVDPVEVRQLGTYGFIKGAKYFIIGVKLASPMDLEDFGYCFERIILLATDLGLGTVWLGGTFKRAEFAKQAHLVANESVPAISPVGYATDKRRLVERVGRRVIKATQRKPWASLYFDGDFATPLAEPTAGSYATALEMVRLGPSAGNGQPWRVVKDARNNSFHFYVQRKGKPGGDVQLPQFTRLDIGIAICHFDLVTREAGLDGEWVVNDPQITPLPPNTRYEASWVEK